MLVMFREAHPCGSLLRAPGALTFLQVLVKLSTADPGGPR